MSAWPAADIDHRAAQARPGLRLTVVTETWPPEINGVALSLARMVDGLHRRGHDITLVRPRQGDADAPASLPRLRQVLVAGLPIPRYPDLRMGLPAGRRLRRLWQQDRPNLVHIATEGPLGWSALRAARALSLPVSSDFRTNFHAYSAHYGIGWLRRPIMSMLRRFHNGCAFTTVPTMALSRELTAAGFSGLEVVSRGVDLKRFDPALRSTALRRQWGAADDDVVALYVGRLAPEKNLQALVAAQAAMLAGQPRSRLVLVGDGPQRAALQALLPQAHFAGQRSGADLATHYASADLFLFPSMTETFGNVVPEAMASGLPVVAFDHAAAGEMVVTGRNGWLAPCGDSMAFELAAARMARDDRRRAWGAQARRDARQRDWDDVVDRLDLLMRRAVMEAAVDRLADAGPLRAPLRP
ncbi:MAG: glycosyltransferase family 4 protein [Aquabacterium sp.]